MPHRRRSWRQVAAVLSTTCAYGTSAGGRQRGLPAALAAGVILVAVVPAAAVLAAAVLAAAVLAAAVPAVAILSRKRLSRININCLRPSPGAADLNRNCWPHA